MEYADKTPPMDNGEIGYTGTIDLMIKDGIPVYAVKIQNGAYYDCGHKLDYIKAGIDIALSNPEVAEGLRAYIRQLNTETPAEAGARITRGRNQSLPARPRPMPVDDSAVVESQGK